MRSQILPIFALIILMIACTSRGAFADDDQNSDRRSISAPVDPTYQAECGSCHMIYPAGMLPARSWQAIIHGLKDHFGEDATMDKATTEKVATFLTNNAADRSELRRSQKIARSIPQNQAPLRITETQYFKRQHHEVNPKIWARKSIGSPSHCVACHQGAEKGQFSEHDIKIPR